MNILLVDDDSTILRIMSKFMREFGHKVFECENGQEALTVLNQEKIHLVLSDVSMPVLGGYELLRKIKEIPELKEVIVVLFTGYSDIKSAVDAMKNGAYDYLLKPINVNELAVIIKRISEYLALKQENLKLTENFNKEVHHATKDLKKEFSNLRKAFAREVGTSEIGIFSDTFLNVIKTAQKLHCKRYIHVLLEGETGTGKEVIARFIHYGEGVVTTPFVGLNCAAISPNLFESELFGYEAGAFSGGNPRGHDGKLRLASGGTIFLDEITELSLDYQAKLLRVIEEREYYRVGGLKKLPADVRFIFASNQDIKQKVSDGTLRQDLYYRMNVGHIVIPPLRERREEILPMAQMFLQRLRNQKKTQFVNISVAAARILEEYAWPGNIRELKNIMERLAYLQDGDEVKPEYLDFLLWDRIAGSKDGKAFQLNNFSLPVEGLDFPKLKLEIVRKALTMNKGNKIRTAEYLGITRRTLYTYLKRIKQDT